MSPYFCEKTDGFLIFLKEFSQETDTSVALGDKEVKGRNGNCYEEDYHSYSHIFGKEFLNLNSI